MCTKRILSENENFTVRHKLLKNFFFYTANTSHKQLFHHVVYNIELLWAGFLCSANIYHH